MNLIPQHRGAFPDRPIPVQVNIWILEDHKITDRLIVIACRRKIITLLIGKIDF